jgi:ferredoxin
MDWIAVRYKECLCSNCLVKIAAGELGPQSDSTSKKQDDRAKQS